METLGPTIAVIPTRMGSTRFPGKPLADETGWPMVRHVCARAAEASTVDEVIVATDDQRIFEAVEDFVEARDGDAFGLVATSVRTHRPIQCRNQKFCM